MDWLRRFTWIAFSLLAAGTLRIHADLIRIEHGCLSISVDGSEQQTPYDVEGTKFRTAAEAAKFLKYLVDHWPNEPKPTIVLEYKSKTTLDDSKTFDAAVHEVAKRPEWKVVCMPVPRGAVPDSWMTADRLAKQWKKTQEQKSKQDDEPKKKYPRSRLERVPP